MWAEEPGRAQISIRSALFCSRLPIPSGFQPPNFFLKLLHAPYSLMIGTLVSPTETGFTVYAMPPKPRYLFMDKDDLVWQKLDEATDE